MDIGRKSIGRKEIVVEIVAIMVIWSIFANGSRIYILGFANKVYYGVNKGVC